MGMVCASRLAQRLDRVDEQCTARQIELFAALGLPIDVPDLDADAITEAMMHDKKVAHGRLRFVLPDRIGHVELVGDISLDDVKASLK